MTDMLEKMLQLHHDPASGAFFTDAEVDVDLLVELIEEDDQAFYIKHNGEYLLYCAKNCLSVPDLDISSTLDFLLQETWGRYTGKKINPDLDAGFDA
jgi:hypothetical protein